MYTIYSAGYQNPGTLALLKKRALAGAIIVDIRQSARSHFKPEYTPRRLKEALGEEHYLRIRELGNVNYQHPEEPHQIADIERGVERLLETLAKQDVCLLCRCPHYHKCHTSTVVAWLQAKYPAIQVTRLGEMSQEGAA